ncbi:hypothetical protein [Parabacteroides distasonis]|uniref:hypothetical protein n=1 Tax=Parabacteroides distasonis TaxID=823 RepID=UPI001F2FF293|nr:hypothetical protein [Parabacteroides distasonis]
MKYFGAGLSESHKELNRIIRKPELIEQTKELFLEIHGKLHLSVVSGNERNEVDELVGDLRRMNMPLYLQRKMKPSLGYYGISAELRI